MLLYRERGGLLHEVFNMLWSTRPSQPFSTPCVPKTRLAPGSLALRAKVKVFGCLRCFTRLALTSLRFLNSCGEGWFIISVFFLKIQKNCLASRGLFYGKTSLLLVRFFSGFLSEKSEIGDFCFKSGFLVGFFFALLKT